MVKEFLSIDISDIRINFVVGRYEEDNINISKMFYIENDIGFFLENEIIDPIAFGKILKECIKKNKVKTKSAIVTVSPKNVEVRDIVIDKVNEEIIEDIVKVELIGQGVELDNYEIQCLFDNNFNEINDTKYKIKAFLMDRKFVSDIRKVLKTCGLKAIHLDISSNGLNKLHRFILDNNKYNEEYTVIEREDATVMYVDLSNKSMYVSIMKGYEEELYRSQDNYIYNAFLKGDWITNEEMKLFSDSIELTCRYYKSTKVGNYVDEVFIYGYNNIDKRLNYLVEVLEEKLLTNVNPLVSIDGILNGNISDDEDISSYLKAINGLIRL